MQFKLNKEQIALLEKNKITHPAVQTERWSGNTQFSSHAVSAEYMGKLSAFAMKKENQQLFNGILQKLSVYARVLKNPKANLPRRLDELQAAIEQAAMVQAPNRWLFSTESEVPSPYLVTEVEYSPAERESPADVTIKMSYSEKGKVRSKCTTYHHDDLKQAKTVEELLMHKGLSFSSEKMVEEYTEYVKDWEVKYAAHNQQFLYNTGTLPDDEDDSDYWNRTDRNEATRISSEFRVVNDVPILKLQGSETTLRLPALNRGAAEDGSEDDLTDVFDVPVHPWVYVFNLETHSHMWIEPHKMTLYAYDPDLVNRLILPESHKELISLLTSNPDTLQADFVRGKSAGTIVMACGEPGLGKTMSAEAFAECSKSILYRVQSDQLGLRPSDIEKNLKDVFGRAERWKAVLLIDEADIYVRARGTDIEQNAIVGTLLRTLEYFLGVMYMTTNKATCIDDAIMSRCSAVITYEFPTVQDSRRIFDQFATLFKMQVSEKIRNEFLSTVGQLSGRSIKNILRLTSRRGFQKPTMENLMSSQVFVR